MNKRIFDYKNDENIELFVLIKSAETRIAKNGKQFIAFNFSDQSGVISAKFWDASKEAIATFTPGKVVYLKGKRELYQNNPQIKIFKLRLAKESEPQDPALFVQKAPEKRAEIEAELNRYLFEITNPTWNRIVRALLKEYQKEFFTFPAAKSNHHAYVGGLAFHTLSILRLAKALGTQYPQLDTSLLYAGAILHDLGKVLELSGPVATSYTLAGNLLGHIVLIDEEIVKTCERLGLATESEDALLLRHMIISHHGLLEYGSPVRPHLVEAEVLHQLDNLDASLQMLDKSLEHTVPGEFTERIFGMDGRNFYRPNEK